MNQLSDKRRFNRNILILGEMQTSIKFGNIRFRPLTKIEIIIILVLKNSLDQRWMSKTSEEEYFVEWSTM